MHRKTSIMIVTARSGYPNGAGAATRLRTLAKGLSERGFDCLVVPLRASEEAEGGCFNTQAQGVFEGVRYMYATGNVRAQRSLVARVCQVARGFVGFVTAFLLEARRGPVAAIYYYMPENPLLLLVAYLGAKALGAKLIGERTEASTGLRGWRGDLFERYAYRLFDGYVVISAYLEAYMRPRLRKAVPIATIPIQVDVDRFRDACGMASERQDVVIYCGATDTNDDVPNCVDVFARAGGGRNGWRLVIVGRMSAEALHRMKVRAKELGLEGSIEFAGGVPQHKIPGLLGRAKIAILPRSQGLFSTAGFPTKLGEYLASGCPVVVSGTGDIPLYIKDGRDAALVQAGDLEAFATSLRDVMERYLAFVEMGERGRATARREFDYRAGCGKLLAAMELRP